MIPHKVAEQIGESKAREAAHVAGFFDGFHDTDTAELKAIREAIPTPKEVKSSGLLPKVARAQSKGLFFTLFGFFHK